MGSDFWQGKKVLVTGAGGFIPSHLVEQLVQLGASVRAFVHYNSRGDFGLLSMVSDEIISEVEVVAGDLRELHTVANVVQGVSHVFHLGALIAIPYSYIHPAEVVDVNVNGTLNILLASRNNDVERIVHTSTSEVYGTALRVPIDESHPLQGQSPYAASKIGADKIAESFYLSYDLPVVTLRPFNTYGPRQSTRAVIPTIISQALTRDAIRLGNLSARRDLTYVTDTVNGFIKVAETSGVEGQTFNLGTGTEITIGDLANEILSIVGRPLEIIVDENRLRPKKSEVGRLLSDNSLAKEKLGWEPEVPLREGLSKVVDWMEEYLHFYRPEVYQL